MKFGVKKALRSTVKVLEYQAAQEGARQGPAWVSELERWRGVLVEQTAMSGLHPRNILGNV
jgi:hypothetical protein